MDAKIDDGGVTLPVVRSDCDPHSIVLAFPVSPITSAPLNSSLTLETIEFCGKRIEILEIALCVRADNWKSTVMLSQVNPNNTSRALALDSEFRKIIRNDTEAEYDANNLCDYLDARVLAGTLTLSPEFRHFEKAWRRDEMNHALGFAMIESFLYDIPIEQVFGELRAKGPKFAPLEDRGFFADEFITAVVIAYDEIATTRAYSEDKKERYPKFENPVLVEWIGRVAADEARHFHNIIAVIKNNYPDRIAEVPGIVRRILDWERTPHEYERTFVLDHTGVQFTGGFLDTATSILLKQFGFTVKDVPPSTLE